MLHTALQGEFVLDDDDLSEEEDNPLPIQMEEEDEPSEEKYTGSSAQSCNHIVNIFFRFELILKNFCDVF